MVFQHTPKSLESLKCPEKYPDMHLEPKIHFIAVVLVKNNYWHFGVFTALQRPLLHLRLGLPLQLLSMVVSTVGQVKINWIKSICLPPNIKIITTPTDRRCLNSMVDLQALTALEFGLNGLRRFQIQSQTEGKIRCWGPDLCTSKPEDWSSQNASDQLVMLSNNTNSVFSYYMYQHGFDS